MSTPLDTDDDAFVRTDALQRLGLLKLNPKLFPWGTPQ